MSEWIANPGDVQVKQWLGKVKVVGLREGAVPALVVRAWPNNLRQSGGEPEAETDDGVDAGGEIDRRRRNRGHGGG